MQHSLAPLDSQQFKQLSENHQEQAIEETIQPIVGYSLATLEQQGSQQWLENHQGHIIQEETQAIMEHSLKDKNIMEEQFHKALMDLQMRVPAKSCDNVSILVSTMYHKIAGHTLTLVFEQNYYESHHWIVSRYEQIMKKKNARKFMYNKFAKNQFDIIIKTEIQMEEVKMISDMAHTLFRILIPCNFVPVEYLALLAGIMKPKIEWHYRETAMAVADDYYIDLLLTVGVVLLKKVRTTETVSNADAIESVQLEFAQLMQDQEEQRSSCPQEATIFPNANWSSQTSTSRENQILAGLTGGNYSLADEDIVLQKTLQHDIDTQNRIQNNFNDDIGEECFNDDIGQEGFNDDIGQNGLSKHRYCLILPVSLLRSATGTTKNNILHCQN